jgi:hypothetical protein
MFILVMRDIYFRVVTHLFEGCEIFVLRFRPFALRVQDICFRVVRPFSKI